MGGGGIKTVGSSRVRVVTAAAALVVAASMAIASAIPAEGTRVGWLWALALVGVAATAVGLAGWAGATWWGVIALGAEYAVLRIGRGPVDIGAAYVAAGSVLVAELVMWSLEARSLVVVELDATVRRMTHLAVLALGTLVLGSLIVSAGRIGHGPALTRTLVGALCSIAVIAVVAWASVARTAQRSPARRTPPGAD